MTLSERCPSPWTRLNWATCRPSGRSWNPAAMAAWVDECVSALSYHFYHYGKLLRSSGTTDANKSQGKLEMKWLNGVGLGQGQYNVNCAVGWLWLAELVMSQVMARWVPSNVLALSRKNKRCTYSLWSSTGRVFWHGPSKRSPTDSLIPAWKSVTCAVSVWSRRVWTKTSEFIKMILLCDKSVVKSASISLN